MLLTGIGWLQWSGVAFFLAAFFAGHRTLFRLVQTNPTVVFDERGITLHERGSGTVVPWSHLRSVGAIGAAMRPIVGITLNDPAQIHERPTSSPLLKVLLALNSGLMRISVGTLLLVQRRPEWRHALFKWSLHDLLTLNESLAGCHLALERFQIDRPVEQFIALARAQARGRAPQAEFVMPSGRYAEGVPQPDVLADAPGVARTEEHPPVEPAFEPFVCRTSVAISVAVTIALIAAAAFLLVLQVTGVSSEDEPALVAGCITAIGLAAYSIVRRVRYASGLLVADADGLHVYARQAALHFQWRDIESIEHSSAQVNWKPSIRLRDRNHVAFLYWSDFRTILLPRPAQRAIHLNMFNFAIDSPGLLSRLQHFHHHFAGGAATRADAEAESRP